MKQMVIEQGVTNIKWSAVAQQLGGRIGKQCRERWFNHLDPAINRAEWTIEEARVRSSTVERKRGRARGGGG